MSASAYHVCYKCGSTGLVPLVHLTPYAASAVPMDSAWCPRCDTLYSFNATTRTWDEDPTWAGMVKRTRAAADTREMTAIAERVMERHGVITALQER